MSVHTEVDYIEVQRMHVIAYRIMVVFVFSKRKLCNGEIFFLL